MFGGHSEFHFLSCVYGFTLLFANFVDGAVVAFTHSLHNVVFMLKMKIHFGGRRPERPFPIEHGRDGQLGHLTGVRV